LDHAGDNAEDTCAAMVADRWGARLAGEDVIMLAGRRSDVDDLNRRARIRRADGRPSWTHVLVDGVPSDRRRTRDLQSGRRSDEGRTLEHQLKRGGDDGTRTHDLLRAKQTL
jgi:hypothetical protein